MNNHYRTLGVRIDAPDVVIKAAYKALSQKHHPDRGGNAEMMQKINKAYETLSDAQAKKSYDNTLKPKPSNTQAEKAHQGSVRLLDEPTGWQKDLELFYYKHQRVIAELFNAAIIVVLIGLSPIAAAILGIAFGADTIIKLCALVTVGAITIATLDNSQSLQRALLENEHGLYDAKSKNLAWVYVAMVVALAAFILFGILG